MADLPEVSLKPSSTSYFSQPESNLDPRLFEGDRMDPNIRRELLGTYYQGMNTRFKHPELWSHVWLAGSGASYQWSAERTPGDLDMLVGVNYPEFRYHNQQYSGLNDTETSWMLNQHMKENLSEHMKSWHGTHEVTWYNNPESEDIKNLGPYAAYSLTDDGWHVHPVQPTGVHLPSPQAEQDVKLAREIIGRYARSRTALQRRDLSSVLRAGHQGALTEAIRQGSALFNDIHEGRREAFLPGGGGYSDPVNIRWQSGKASGVVQAMRAMNELDKAGITEEQMRIYGTTFPDPSELIVRAMIGVAEDPR